MLKKTILINFLMIALSSVIIVTLFLPSLVGAQDVSVAKDNGLNDGNLSFINTTIVSYEFDEYTRELSIDTKTINSRDIFIDNLKYSVELYEGDELQDSGYVLQGLKYTLTETGDFEQMYPNETVQETIVYQVPENINPANYFIRFIIFDDDHFSFGMDYSRTPIFLDGTGEFIPFIRADVIDKEGTVRAPQEGSIIEKQDSLTVSINETKNPELFELVSEKELFYNVDIYRANDDVKVASVEKTQLLAVDGNIDIELAPYDEAVSGPHEARFYITDTDGNSAVEYFPIRYTYKGLTGRFTDIQTYFNTYERGTSLDLEVEFAYAGNIDTEYVTINATVYSDGEEQSFSRVHNLRNGWIGQVLDQEVFTGEELKGQGRVTKIEVQMLDPQGNILDTKTFEPDAEITLKKERESNFGAWIKALITIVVIILIVFVLVLIKRHSRVTSFTAMVIAAFLFSGSMVYIAPQIHTDVFADSGNSGSSDWSTNCSFPGLANDPISKTPTQTADMIPIANRLFPNDPEELEVQFAPGFGDYNPQYQNASLSPVNYVAKCISGNNNQPGDIKGIKPEDGFFDGVEGDTESFEINGSGEWSFVVEGAIDSVGKPSSDSDICLAFVKPPMECMGCSSEGKVGPGGAANPIQSGDLFFAWGALDKGNNDVWIPSNGDAKWDITVPVPPPINPVPIPGNPSCEGLEIVGGDIGGDRTPKSDNVRIRSRCSWEDICDPDNDPLTPPPQDVYISDEPVSIKIGFAPDPQCNPDDPECGFDVRVQEFCSTPPDACISPNYLGPNVMEQTAEFADGPNEGLPFEGNLGACTPDGNPTDFISYLKFECPTDSSGGGAFTYQVDYWNNSYPSDEIAPDSTTGPLSIEDQDAPGINTWIRGPFLNTAVFVNPNDNFNNQDLHLKATSTFPQNSYCVLATDPNVSCPDVKGEDIYTRPYYCTTPGTVDIDVWHDFDGDNEGPFSSDTGEDYIDDSKYGPCEGELSMDLEVRLTNAQDEVVYEGGLPTCSNSGAHSRAHIAIPNLDPGEYNVELTKYDDDNYEVTGGGAFRTVTMDFGSSVNVHFGLDSGPDNCITNDDCSGTEVCSTDNICVPPCETNADCVAGDICSVEDICVTPCENDTDCSGLEVCTPDNICVVPRLVDAECKYIDVTYDDNSTERILPNNNVFLINRDTGTDFDVEWTAVVNSLTPADQTLFNFELDVLSRAGVQDSATGLADTNVVLGPQTFNDQDYGTETVYIDIESQDRKLATQLECSIAIGNCVVDDDCSCENDPSDPNCSINQCSNNNICEVPPPDVTIEMDPKFINESATGDDRCGITTFATFYQDGQRCELVKVNDSAEKALPNTNFTPDLPVEAGGEDKEFPVVYVGPGSYRAKCYPVEGEAVYSNTEICRANPVIREF